jgi:hypothetical protein
MKKLLFILPLLFYYSAISQEITKPITDSKEGLGTQESVAIYGSGEYTFKRGKIISNDGKAVNGFYVRGKEIGRTTNGFIQYGDNKIIISKNTVRKMWKDENLASKVLYHYHWICNKLYTGVADSLAKLHGDDAAKILLEIGAHQFIQDYFKSDESDWINYYPEKLSQLDMYRKPE